MIPITTFGGKKVAVFGLGGSGLASCQALAAGKAEVIASDDDPGRMAEAARAGFATADLHEVDWSKIAALVLAPGVPLTHPAPHWSVSFVRAAGVPVVGDIELFCRERRRRACHGHDRRGHPGRPAIVSGIGAPDGAARPQRESAVRQ